MASVASRRIGSTRVVRQAEPLLHETVRKEVAVQGEVAKVRVDSVNELVRQQLIGVEKQMTSVKNELAGQVGGVEKQMNSVKNELTTLNEKVGGVEKQLGSVKNELVATVGGLEKKLDAKLEQQDKTLWRVTLALLGVAALATLNAGIATVTGRSTQQAGANPAAAAPSTSPTRKQFSLWGGT
jgi:archaellum component FlaC